MPFWRGSVFGLVLDVAGCGALASAKRDFVGQGLVGQVWQRRRVVS